MNLNEFRKLSKEEIGQLINLQLVQEQHSTKEAMQASGYEFSWGSMRNVAEDMGLVLGFFDPTGEISNTTMKEFTPVEEIVIELDRKRLFKTRRVITFDKEVIDMLDSILVNFKRDADRGKVYDTIFRLGLDALLKAFAKGKVTIKRNVPELSMDEMEMQR